MIRLLAPLLRLLALVNGLGVEFPSNTISDYETIDDWCEADKALLASIDEALKEPS